MELIWAETAKKDYLYWHQKDKKILQRINKLIEATKQDPFKGIGNPEPLRHNWTGYWSRRITKEHRLVYKIKDGILMAQCRYHY